MGLRIRPPAQFPDNRTFGAYLEKSLKNNFPQRGVAVHNLCIGRSTIWDIICRGDEILRQFPNYYIICVGVTDASTREIPLWYSNIINNQCVSLKKRVFTAIYNKILKPLRPYIVRLRRGKPWTTAKQFDKYFNFFLEFLLKGTNAHLLVLTINNTTDRVERQLPGSRMNYKIYNSIIVEACNNDRVTLVDTRQMDVLSELPDGIHYSNEGHRKVASYLLKAIMKQEAHRDNDNACLDAS